MQVFGLWGLLIGGAGFAVTGWLVLGRIFWGQPLTDRPLLLLAVVAMLFGIQLLFTGLLADLVARTYHESQRKQTYAVRQRTGEATRPDPLPRSDLSGSDPPSA